jgi:phage baseplate assembly protein W
MSLTSNSNKFPFIGKGWSFPPSFDKTVKGVVQREGNDDIVESLNIILTTLPGERIFDSKFGCDLTPLLFQPLTNTLKTTLSKRIEMAIILYETRIRFENVNFNISTEEGIVYISIQYLIKSYNSRYNMIFPFYLKEGTER